MSTKTTIKRMALVAAAALAIGGISAVSANAAATGTPLASTNAVAGYGTTSAGTVTAAVVSPFTVTRASATTWTAPVSIAVTGTSLGFNDTFSVTGASVVTAGTGVPTATLAATVASATSATITGKLTISAVSATVANVVAAVDTYALTLTVHDGLTNAAAAAVNFVVPALATTGTFGSAGTIAASGSGGALVQAVNGQATVDFINGTGTGDTSYTVTSSGPGTMISASAGTAPVNLNATTAAGGFTWTPVTTRQDLTVTVTSAVTGVQTISFQPIGANGAPGIPVLATITWGGGVTFSPTSTVVRQGSAVPAKVIAGDAPGATSATVLSYTTALDAVPQSAVKTAGTAGSVIEVVTLNSDGSAAYQGNTVSATITGSGLITASTTAPVAATDLAVTGSARTSNVVLTGSNVAYIYVNADGTAGTGTVTVSVTNAITGVSTVVGTKIVTFYGSVAKLTASVNYSIGRAGYTTGAAATTLDASSAGSPLAALTTAPAFIITATDSNGNAVTTASGPSVSSSDTTVVTGGACALDDGSTPYSSSSNGVGVYNCSFTSAPNAVSGAKATLTIKVLNPADATGTTYITTTIPVSIGGKVAKTVLTTDAASYSAGQAMTITITAKDSAGNPVYDGAASPAVSANKSVIGLPIASFFVGGVVTTDTPITGVKTAYAPATGGDFTLTETDSALLTSTVTATVADAASDAADAATSAAQDAGAKADAALAAVTALSAKITVLAAQIAKIVKKLKA